MALLRSDVINKELLEQVLKKVEVNKRLLFSSGASEAHSSFGL